MNDQASTLRQIMGVAPPRLVGVSGGWLTREIDRLTRVGGGIPRVATFDGCGAEQVLKEILIGLTTRMQRSGSRVALVSPDATFAFGPGKEIHTESDLVLADTSRHDEDQDRRIDCSFILVGTTGDALVRGIQSVRSILRRHPDRAMGVIAIDTRDGREGWKVYRGLLGTIGQSVDTSGIQYAGHFPKVCTDSFLLKSDDVSMKEQCLDLVAKRVGEIAGRGEE